MSNENAPHSSAVQSVTIEFGDDNNRTISVAVLHENFRGRFSIAGLHNREGVPGRSVGEKMGIMPDIPGMRIEFLPKECSIRIFDPLEEDTAKLAKINAAMSTNSIQGVHGGVFKCVPSRVQKLKDYEFKSLLREVLVLVACKSATVVAGKLSKREVIDNLPGKYLHDPGDNISHDKQRFEDEVAVAS